MRGKVIIALILVAALCGDGAASTQARKRMPACMSEEEWNRLADKLAKHPPYITPARLPEGMHIGRCLLQVEGKTLISGTCAYSMAKDGSFGIQGPRQIYSGIDYPECFFGAATFTTDRFAAVEWVKEGRLDDGSPSPGWNAGYDGALGSNHLEGFIGRVTRRGACFENKRAKICLWRN